MSSVENLQLPPLVLEQECADTVRGFLVNVGRLVGELVEQSKLVAPSITDSREHLTDMIHDAAGLAGALVVIEKAIESVIVE